MKFKGDIIITDPCYIIKKSEYRRPNHLEFGVSEELMHKLPVDYTDEDKALLEPYTEASDKYWNEIRKDDWDKCEYGDNMEVLGINNYLTSSTLYGDCSCTTFEDTTEIRKFIKELNILEGKLFNMDEENENFTNIKEEYDNLSTKIGSKIKILGHFCADAGLVSVFLLDEVLKYNPKFDYHINRLHTTTLIKDFDGDVEIVIENDQVSVVGKGNVNFFTSQTGF